MPSGGADLHVHSLCSDGTLPPAKVVELAAERGLEAISLTDHDTVAGWEEAAGAGRRFGVRILAGVEMSAEFRGFEIHLLGYGFDPFDAPLREDLQRSRRGREERADRILDRLSRLGLRLDPEDVAKVTGSAAPGRPHLAEALLRAGHVRSRQEAFNRYLNPGAPAHVPWERPSAARVREAIRRAGGLVVLAHPHLNLSSGNILALVEDGIDGLEAHHPGLKPIQSRELKALAGEKGLVVTGGSDCHGDFLRGPLLGTVRVPVEVVDRIEGPRRGGNGAVSNVAATEGLGGTDAEARG